MARHTVRARRTGDNGRFATGEGEILDEASKPIARL